MSSDEIYDPLSEQSHTDPYPSYAVLRQHAPVYYCAHRQVWALSRYDDVQAALRDWENFSSAQGVEMAEYVGFFGRGNFLEMDPPEHDVTRRLLATRFSSRSIKSYEPIVRECAEDILRSLPKAGLVDLGTGFTQQLPVLTICRLLGLPEDEIRSTVDKTTEMMRRPAGQDRPSPHAEAVRKDLCDLFEELVAVRGDGSSHDDILGDIAKGVSSGLIDRSDVAGMCLLLIVAGMETTSSLLGNVIYALANGEISREQVLDGHGRMSVAATDEFLRHDSPVQWLCRVTTADVRIHNVVIPAGERVLLLYGSANRDDEVFQSPNELQFDRGSMRNLAFGDGIHFCLGMPLAKLEARVGVEVLATNYSAFTTHDRPTRYPSHIIRGYETIPVLVR
ncbi:MAG: cytochrome P450 [Candidatus Nanopelagicales bacterium]|nr:cytochrome P450 [Candidatus Nanopelagicales bacterium]